MSTRSATLIIRTPEGILFPLILADPITRFLALVIDLACIYIVSSTVAALLSVVRLLSVDWAAAFVMVSSALISFCYPILLEWRWQGRTVGKRIMRLQVMDVQGLRLQFSQVVIRNLLRVVDMLPAFYMVGGLASLFTARSQRLGDLAANTIVVYHPAIAEPDLDEVMAGKFNSFRDYPHLAARLRQEVAPREAQVALQAILRRDEFDDDARLSLFAGIRRHLQSRVVFPSEAVESLSDEQYVRNTLDILFRAQTRER